MSLKSTRSTAAHSDSSWHSASPCIELPCQLRRRFSRGRGIKKLKEHSHSSLTFSTGHLWTIDCFLFEVRSATIGISATIRCDDFCSRRSLRIDRTTCLEVWSELGLESQRGFWVSLFDSLSTAAICEESTSLLHLLDSRHLQCCEPSPARELQACASHHPSRYDPASSKPEYLMEHLYGLSRNDVPQSPVRQNLRQERDSHSRPMRDLPLHRIYSSDYGI